MDDKELTDGLLDGEPICDGCGEEVSRQTVGTQFLCDDCVAAMFGTVANPPREPGDDDTTGNLVPA